MGVLKSTNEVTTGDGLCYPSLAHLPKSGVWGPRWFEYTRDTAVPRWMACSQLCPSSPIQGGLVSGILGFLMMLWLIAAFAGLGRHPLALGVLCPMSCKG